MAARYRIAIHYQLFLFCNGSRCKKPKARVHFGSAIVRLNSFPFYTQVISKKDTPYNVRVHTGFSLSFFCERKLQHSIRKEKMMVR